MSKNLLEGRRIPLQASHRDPGIMRALIRP